MKYKILNFVLDEKFIDDVISNHDLTNEICQHEYLLVSDRPYKFKYIHKFDRIRIIKTNDIYNEITRDDIDGIFLHALYSCPLKIIHCIPNRIKVFWFAWGYDIYEQPYGKPLINLPLYQYLTKSLLDKIDSSTNITDIIKTAISKIKKFRFKKNLDSTEDNLYLKAINRIDYFSGVFPYEYELVKEQSNFKAKPVCYRYGRHRDVDLNENIFTQGNNILIGNSANPTNNHLDIFEKLKDFKLKDSKIIVPLSYSQNQNYVKHIISQGKKLFKHHFRPLTSFIAPKEYIQLLQSCKAGVFLIERQQAIGNINEMLIQGKKIYLSESSGVYQYYKSIGLSVFSFQRDFSEHNIAIPLTEDEIKRNKKIILDRYTTNSIILMLKDLYETLN